MRFPFSLSVLLCTAIFAFGQDIAITGTIKDTDGNIIKNALIKFENLDYVTVSSEDGKFLLTNSSPIQRSQPITSAKNMLVSQNALYFTCEKHEPLTVTIFSLQGKQCSSRHFSDLSAGSYQLGLQSVIPAHLASGTYVVAATLNGKRVAGRVLHRPGNQQPILLTPVANANSSFRFAKQYATLDVVTISKLGYVSQSVEIESYDQELGEIVLEKSSALSDEEKLAALEDSLIQVFLERLEAIGNLEGPDELKTIDYISIRNGFEAILDIDSTRIGANIGYMLTAIASLNVNPRIWELTDSLDAYFSSFDDDDDEYSQVTIEEMKEEEFFGNAMANGGVLTLGKALTVKSPQVLKAATENPSFPKFITISYLQNMIERDFIPVLSKVMQAANRVEAYSEGSLKITVEEETIEIDKGEVYLFDASVNLIQAYLFMLCTYDMDLYTSESQQNYSWIDSMVAIEHDDQTVYALSGDTLLEITTWTGEKKSITTALSMLQYNLEERDDFMTIRRDFHTMAHNCLLAVPAKIRGGLDAIKEESDDQDDDIIKIAFIDSANAEMVDISEKMVEEGVSAELAANFSSVENLLDFTTELLSGPYTFSEVIDGKEVSMKIDLSAFFTNPVEDLRDLLPYYTWTNKEDWTSLESDLWVNEHHNYEFVTDGEGTVLDTLYSFYVYDDDVTVAIDESLIDSIVDDYGITRYYINQPVNHRAYVDSSYYFNALRLTDSEGTVLDEETMEEMMENGTFFPHFKDYTLNGLFPEMTREKWIDLIWSE